VIRRTLIRPRLARQRLIRPRLIRPRLARASRAGAGHWSPPLPVRFPRSGNSHSPRCGNGIYRAAQMVLEIRRAGQYQHTVISAF
jgi:hypothetical protein